MDDELNVGNVTADAQVTTDAPAQAQPTAKNEDVDQVVNRLLDQRLATEVERRVQSELQKRKNRADKELAEDKRAIERMAKRGLLDEEGKNAQLAAAERDAEASRAVWHYEEEPTYQQPAPTQRQPEPSSQTQPRDDDADFRAFVKDVYGFDPKEQGMEYSNVLNVKDANDPAVKEFRRNALQKGAELEKRRTNAETVKKGVDDYGPTGGLATGSSAPPANRLEHVTDSDELFDIAADEEWAKINKGRR
jgi:hypothetical protein